MSILVRVNVKDDVNQLTSLPAIPIKRLFHLSLTSLTLSTTESAASGDSCFKSAAWLFRLSISTHLGCVCSFRTFSSSICILMERVSPATGPMASSLSSNLGSQAAMVYKQPYKILIKKQSLLRQVFITHFCFNILIDLIPLTATET